MSHHSLRGRKITMRPVLDQGRIAQISKPTRVTRGVHIGYSMPIWNGTVNADEEMYYRTRVHYRWDGETDPVGKLVCYLSGAEDVGDKFKFEMSYSAVKEDVTFPDTTTDAYSEKTVATGRTAQYSKYEMPFTFDSSVIADGDLLSARLRRVAASSSEIANEVVGVYFVIEYRANKCFGVWD